MNRLLLLPLFFLLTTFTTYANESNWKAEVISGVSVRYYIPRENHFLKSKNHKRALMINLHGCSQKTEDLKNDGNWENTADDYNMIVVLPEVPNAGVIAGCWDYYGPDHTMTNRHNGPLIELTKALLKNVEFNIDPGQVYLSGLSSGGGQTMVLGCMMPDLFAGIGINAGPSTGTVSNEIGRPKTSYETMLETCKKLGHDRQEFFKTQLTSVIYGNNDYIVSPLFNVYNAEIMHTIYEANEKSYFDVRKLAGAFVEGMGTLWSDSAGARVSLIMNSFLGHNWPSGQGGNGGSFINKMSVNYPDYLAKFFFSNNRRSKEVVLPDLVIDPILSDDSKFTLSGMLTIPKETIKKLELHIKKKEDHSLVEKIDVSLDKDNRFLVDSKNLSEGEYYFDFHLFKTNGVNRIFKRSFWLGEISSFNLPQIFNIEQSTQKGCYVMKAQAISNSIDQLHGVFVRVNNKRVIKLAVKKTKWQFKTCDLPAGKHKISIWAENKLGAKNLAQEFVFEIIKK